MKKIFTLLLVLTSLFSFSQSTTVVISQVYGAGGNAGALLKADFVELHNVSGSSFDLTGHSIQYASAASTTSWSGVYALPSVSIPAGGYYLIQMSADGANGTALPTPDAVAAPSIAMASASGKVALVNGIVALTGCTLTGVVDLVGYGAANCSETSPTANLSSTVGAIRNNDGCTDTDNNSSDFTVTAPAPRNSATTAVTCSTPTGPAVTAGTLVDFGNVNVGSTSTTQTFDVSGSDLTGFPGNITVTAPSTDFQVSLDGINWSASVDIPYSSATLAATQVFVQFVPQSAGAITGDISIDGGGITTPVLVAVSGTGVAATSPAITAGTLVDFGNVTVGSASASQTFDVAGTDLTGFPGNITVTAPSTDFQVSLDGVNWSASVDIPYNSATLTATQVFVQFVPQSAGPLSGNITINGGGIAAPVTVAVSGNGIAAGVPNISTSTLTAFGDVCVNTTTTAPASFTLTGTDLTTADVTIGPLAGFTFSETSGGTFTPTLTITQPGGTFNQTVWVQFTPTAVQSYDGNIPVSGGGTAASVNVAASGAGINSAATVVTGNASAITTNSATLEGSISANGCSPITAYGFEYSTTPGFSGGTVVNSTNLTGTTYSAGIASLAPSTTYYYKAFATNGGGTTYGAELSFTTLAPAPSTVTATPLSDFGSVCVNSTAGPLSFTLTGTDLTTADITVGPLAGFTFSETAAGTYTNTLTLTQGGGAFTQEVFVQFTPDNNSIFDGNIPVNGGGLTTPLLVAATGNGNGTGPQVATTDSLVLNHQSAVLSGQLISLGCGTVTDFGIEYSGIQGFANGQGTKVPGDSITLLNTFSSRLNNLAPGTRYYFKAYSTSGGVTSYGEERSFTTLPLPTGLVIYGNPVQRGTTMHFSISSVERGHYSARLYNMLGQVVFQRDLIVPVGFIDDEFTVPSMIPAGVYTFEVINHKFRIGRQILVK